MVIALGALAAVLAALFVLLVLAAAFVLAEALSSLFSNVPVIGSTVRGWIDSAITFMVHNVTARYISGVGVIAGLFRALYQPVLNAYDTVFNALHAAATQLHYLLFSYVPAAVQGAETFANAAILRIAADIDNTIGHVESWTTALVHGVAVSIDNTIGGVETWVGELVHGVAVSIDNTIGDVQTWVAGEIDQTRQALAAATHDVIDWATAEIDATRTQAAAEAEAALGAALGAVAGTRAYLGAEVLPAIADLTKVAEECATPYCAEKNALGQELHTLTQLLELGPFLAFLAAAIAEPTATAHDTAVVGDAIATPIVAAARALV